MEKKIININKGLFTDTAKSMQPENSTPFVLNGMFDNGDQGYYSNEKGNKPCYSLPDGFTQHGQIAMLDGEFVVFAASDTTSIIGVVDRFCVFTELIRASCLNFNPQYQISGEFRLRRGCDRTIYFTDDFNPIRTINLDDLNQYKDDAGNWDCDRFDLFRSFQHPCFSNITVNNTGGSLSVGTIQFAIQYLDSNLNPTNWITVSNVIPIVSGDLNGVYLNVEGGIDEKSNKSVTLNISNLDEDFVYYRIGILYHLNGVTTGYIKPYTEINSSTSTYLYQGVNEDVDEIADPSEFSVPRLPYTIAKTIKQLDNKLVIGNIKDKKYNWSKFQQKAMDITSEYETKAMKAEDMDHWSPKTFRYYNDTRSYMRDEVYAFGIVWIFNDGSVSPAFHIPGRTKITDSTLVTIGNSNIHNRPTVITNNWDDEQIAPNFDTQHLPSVQNAYKRWEIYNTAIRSNINYDPNTPYYTKGKLAYYESTQLYPETTDCDGNYIYGTSAGTPIRHHKFPDTTLEPHFVDGSVNGTTIDITSFSNVSTIIPMGIRFHDIEPPLEYQNSVIGYKIVRSLRTEDNSTIIDKGVLFGNTKFISNDNILNGTRTPFAHRQSYPYYSESVSGSNLSPTIPITLVENDDFRFCDDFFATYPSIDSFSFHSPKTKFSNIIQGDYLKIERELQGTVSYYLFDATYPKNYLSLVKYTNTYIPASNINNTNKTITNQQSIDALVEGRITDVFVNQNQQETCVITIGSGLEKPSNLTDTIYLNNNSSNRRSSNALSHCYYVSLKKYNPSMYNSLSSIIYNEVTTCYINKNSTSAGSVDPIYGGDTFISQLWIRKTFESAQKDDCTENEITDDQDERALFGTWMESTINSELRYEGILDTDTTLDVTDRCNEGYYPKTFADPGGLYIQNGKTRDYLERESTCINSYLYNDDFSKENQILFYFPLPITFNYCAKCSNQFKNRIAVSQTSYQEQTEDNYRVFLANTYKDVGAATGEITNLLNKNNKLYIQTENSLFSQEVRPQTLRSDQATLYVSTGEPLEQPVNEITTSDDGYAGSINKVATLNTSYGIFFISLTDKKIFNFSDKLNELSNSGISNWLQNNMLLEFREQMKRFLNLDINPDNPAYRYGIGYTSAFDKINFRLLISKKDYKFIDEELIGGYTSIAIGNETSNFKFKNRAGTIGNQQINSIYFDTDNNYFFKRINSVSIEIIEFSDATYFENRSWTLSYNLKYNAWVSWHSYLPSHMFNINNRVYSHNGTNTGYEHNTGVYQRYYNSYKPFMIEHVISKNYLQTLTYPSIQYLSNVTKDTINYPTDTFTKCWMYNDYQSTGIQPLVLKDSNPFSIVSNSSGIFVDRTERQWSINKYRDIVDNTTNPQSLFKVDWSSINTDYYIDKIPNPVIHNLNKSVYTKERLRDVYMVARLIYEDFNNKQLTIRFLMPVVNESAR
jgi:hypothetical protein